MSKQILVTSALPYVNNVPHLGNIIGSTLSADVYARFKRKQGHKVLFVCGSDQYGTSTEVKALEEGLGHQELCDKYHKIHEEVYKWFNLSFDIWGQTTNPSQTPLTQQIFLDLWHGGHIEEKEVTQLFCGTCNRFISDRYVYGLCYHDSCKGIVKGDQCDTCCKLVDVNLLKKRWCFLCNNVPIEKVSPHLFIKLQDFEKSLREYFLGGLPYLSPTAQTITETWLKEGTLESRCITRDLVWGTPLPENVEGLEKYENKVFYVWFDAPIGYLSILKDGLEKKCGAEVDIGDWKTWIPNGDPSKEWAQFMAKDNVLFHSIFFPSTLLGTTLNLGCGVTHLSATEYLTHEGKKFSKSNGVGIFGDTVQTLAESLGIDEDYFRFYLIKIRPENGDSDFSWKDFAGVVRGELVNKIGNLVNRYLVLLKKLSLDSMVVLPYDLTECVNTDELNATYGQYEGSFNAFRFRDVVKHIIRFAEIGNGYFHVQKPWKIGNLDNVCFGNVGAIINIMGEILEPICPKKAAKIKEYVDLVHEGDIWKKGCVHVKLIDIEILFKQIDLTLIGLKN